jgi:hypothetical protein
VPDGHTERFVLVKNCSRGLIIIDPASKLVSPLAKRNQRLPVKVVAP